MTALVRFSELPLMRALGWSLLNFCWQGTLVAILLACILGLLQGRSPRVRYMLSCVALVAMISLPLVTFGILATRPRSGEKPPTFLTMERTSDLNMQTGLSGITEPWFDRIEKSLNSSLPGVTAFWFAGVILFLSRLNIGLMTTRKLKFLATQPSDGELQFLLRALSCRLAIDRTVRIMNSALVQAPTVIGWLRPVILIPVGCMAGFSPVQVEAILAHELAHIRRHDYLVSLCQSVTETLLFYHPAVWWVSKQMRNEREHCCDDLAVAVTGDPLAYAKSLSQLEEKRGSLAAPALGADGGLLKMRIRRLLGCKEAPNFSRTAAVLLLAVVAAPVWFSVIGVARAQQNQSEQPVIDSGNGAEALSGVYRKWLDEDVRWIITPQERTAYLRLPDNAERDQFIKEFWQRRNPTPGDAENRFKEEHYRRVAYANVHFATAGEAGWRTDRGRIYIVYGPPDAIDAHPSGLNDAGKPMETWQYRSIQSEPGTNLSAPAVVRHNVDLKFVDSCNCGDYQLEPAAQN